MNALWDQTVDYTIRLVKNWNFSLKKGGKNFKYPLFKYSLKTNNLWYRNVVYKTYQKLEFFMKKRKNKAPKNPISSICLYFKYSQKIYKALYQSKDYIIGHVKNLNFPLTNKEKLLQIISVPSTHILNTHKKLKKIVSKCILHHLRQVKNLNFS